MLIKFKKDQGGRASLIGWGPFEVVSTSMLNGQVVYKFKHYNEKESTWKTANLFQWRFDIVEDNITIEDLL